jgi:hypothetical protein
MRTGGEADDWKVVAWNADDTADTGNHHDYEPLRLDRLRNKPVYNRAGACYVRIDRELGIN